jgi:glycosyltransferase involved in cell wall biosynthesis
MGSHEGLGLGFYESLYCGTPILTIDWTPNNEIIKDNINGWLIDSTFSDIYDNDNSLINKAIISENLLKEKIIEILTNNRNTLKIINNTIKEKDDLYLKNKNSFYKNLTEILST